MQPRQPPNRVLRSLRKLASSSQQTLSTATSTSRLSFKQRPSHADDLLPGRLQCLRLDGQANVDSLFAHKFQSVLTHGDVTLVSLCTDRQPDPSLGVLVSSGMLFLYEYDLKDRRLLYFRIGISVLGAAVTLEGEKITVKTNIDIVLKVASKKDADRWYQKLCEACTGIEVVPRKKPGRLWHSVKGRMKEGGSVSETVKTQLDFMKESWKLPQALERTRSQPWNLDTDLVSKIKHFKDSQSRHSKPSLLPDPGFVIDSNFKISSKVRARMSSLEGASREGRFCESNACLTQNLLTVSIDSREVSLAMEECHLDVVKNLKWGIRVSSALQEVDIQLTSKEAYEDWTLAFMKTYAFHSKARCAVERGGSVTDAPFRQDDESTLEVVDVPLNLQRCLSCPKNLSVLSQMSEKTHHSIPRDFLSLANETSQISSTNKEPQSAISLDHVFVTPRPVPAPRMLPQRNSSCLDHPIPILPGIALRESVIESCHSSCLDIYEEMKHDCCNYRQHFRDDDNTMPLPIKCKKHGIGERIKRSCQNITRKLTKSSEVGRNSKPNNRGLIGAISNRFRSEMNLRSAERSDRRMSQGNQNSSQSVEERERNRYSVPGISSSVFDIRGPRYDTTGWTFSDPEINEEDSEYEEYEEPISVSKESI